VLGVPFFSFLGALNYSFDSRKVVDAGLKAVSLLYACSFDQVIFRKVSQWPNAMFKVPDLLEWFVLAHEPKVVAKRITEST